MGELYGVETKVLKQAVRRNISRFPDDFIAELRSLSARTKLMPFGYMFELSKEEFQDWRSQFVTSREDKIGLRYSPMAFTEQGVAMLSSVLKSNRAIEVNIAIMRAFVHMRQMLATHKDLKRKIEEMESKYDGQFRLVFETIHQLLAEDEKPKRKIGF